LYRERGTSFISCHKKTRTGRPCTQSAARPLHTSVVTKRRTPYMYTERSASFAYIGCHKKTRTCTQHTSVVTKRRAPYMYTDLGASFAYISCHKKTRTVHVERGASIAYISQLSQKDSQQTCTQSAAVFCTHKLSQKDAHQTFTKSAARPLHTSIVTKRRAPYMYTEHSASFAYIGCHKKMRPVHVHRGQRVLCIHQLSQKDAPRTCTQSAARLLHTSVVTKRRAPNMYTAW
jgi:hypothetical protein